MTGPYQSSLLASKRSAHIPRETVSRYCHLCLFPPSEPSFVFAKHVDDLDRILDELEDLARSDLPSSRFFLLLVERLRLTLVTRSAVLMLPIDAATWLPIASSGDECGFVSEELRRRLENQNGEPPETLLGSHGHRHWVAVPLRPRNFSKGCLVVCAEERVPESIVASYVELIAAFAEIVTMRQNAELESFLDNYWQRTQLLCRQVGTTTSMDEACALLADGLAQSLKAARVSMMTKSRSGAVEIRAVSGVPSISPRSRTVRSLQQLGRHALESGQPILRHQSSPRPSEGQSLSEVGNKVDSNGMFENLICTRLFSGSPSLVPSTAVALEYQSYPELIGGATKLPHLLPMIAIAWEQHARWLGLPRAMRLLTMAAPRAPSIGATLSRWAAAVCLILLLIWGLQKPYPLLIEAVGAYEPVVARSIYSTADGFVDELLAEDGDSVEVGQPLAKLRSPSLELKIEQVEGESRSIDEESNGIRIALNQLDFDGSEVLNHQSRLASRIAELETKQQSLQRQLELLRGERQRLVLLSPIAGFVVAKDLKQHLAGRPVKRGDPLFSVVDLQGPWHIRVQVADRDSGYLLSHYGTQRDKQLASEIDFVLDSSPSDRLRAKIQWIADQVENRHGEGCFVEVRATTDQTVPVGVHAGAGVHAYFHCGMQPIWFVWCRPLIEAAQRRLWFRSNESND